MRRQSAGRLALSYQQDSEHGLQIIQEILLKVGKFRSIRYNTETTKIAESLGKFQENNQQGNCWDRKNKL